MDVRAEIVSERHELIGLLRGLTAEQWTTPSLCAGWTVRDVVAHLVTPYAESPAHTALEMLRRRSMARAMQAMADRVGGQRSENELLALLVDRVDEVFVPPGLPAAAPLTDVIVHGADIRVPLGEDPDRPWHRVVHTLDFVTSWRAAPMFLPFGRLRGVALSATDGEWSHGTGAPARGRAIDLLLAVLGRRSALTALEGSGVDVISSRLG